GPLRRLLLRAAASGHAHRRRGARLPGERSRLGLVLRPARLLSDRRRVVDRQRQAPRDARAAVREPRRGVGCRTDAEGADAAGTAAGWVGLPLRGRQAPWYPRARRRAT